MKLYDKYLNRLIVGVDIEIERQDDQIDGVDQYIRKIARHVTMLHPTTHSGVWIVVILTRLEQDTWTNGYGWKPRNSYKSTTWRLNKR